MKILTRVIVGGCVAILVYAIVGTTVQAVREIKRATKDLRDIDVEFNNRKFDEAKSCEITPIFKGES